MKQYEITYYARIVEKNEETGIIAKRQQEIKFDTAAKRALCAREIISRCKKHDQAGTKGYFIGLKSFKSK